VPGDCSTIAGSAVNGTGDDTMAAPAICACDVEGTKDSVVAGGGSTDSGVVTGGSTDSGVVTGVVNDRVAACCGGYDDDAAVTIRSARDRAPSFS